MKGAPNNRMMEKIDRRKIKESNNSRGKGTKKTKEENLSFMEKYNRPLPYVLRPFFKGIN